MGELGPDQAVVGVAGFDEAAVYEDVAHGVEGFGGYEGTFGPGLVGAVLVNEVSQVILREVGEEGSGALGYFFVLSGGKPC